MFDGCDIVNTRPMRNTGLYSISDAVPIPSIYNALII